MRIAGVTKRFGGLVALEQRLVRSDARRDRRADRTQRRRQDDARQCHHRRAAGPTPARYSFKARRIDRLPAYQIARRGIGRTFQIVQPFPRMTVLENVAAGAMFAGRPNSVAAAKDRAAECLDFVGLSAVSSMPAVATHAAGAQAAGTGQRPRHQSEAAAAGRGQCRTERHGDRRRAGSDQGHCRARHHHSADRASDEGGDARLVPDYRAASGRADRRRAAGRRYHETPRWSRPISARTMPAMRERYA